MPKSEAMRINPLTVTGFMGFYKVLPDRVVAEYHKYLVGNVECHHYYEETLAEWYQRELQDYIDSLIQKNDRLEDAVEKVDYSQAGAWAN